MKPNEIHAKRTLVEASGMVPAFAQAVPLPPLDCSITAGTITCLIGPLGIAKESYLRTLACVEPPVAGTVRLLDQPSYLEPERWRELRQHAVFIMRDAPLLSNYDGFLNVVIPSLYHHLADEEHTEQQARQLIAESGIERDVHVLPAYLGEYERRCLAIIRGLMLDPELVFIDDTFRQLEHEEIREMGAYLTRLARDRGLAVIASTFDLRLAREQADLIIFLAAEGVSTYQGWDELIASDRQEVRDFLHIAADLKPATNQGTG